MTTLFNLIFLRKESKKKPTHFCPVSLKISIMKDLVTHIIICRKVWADNIEHHYYSYYNNSNIMNGNNYKIIQQKNVLIEML